jgi:hypothetical protein
METKYTPGPWKNSTQIGAPKHCSGAVIADNGYLVAGQLRHGDALLIAAAPELLEALESAIYALTDGDQYNKADTLIKINAAIKKAKGE